MLERDDLLKDSRGNNFIDMNGHSNWIEFFLIFSRFEYALKRSGYIKANRGYIEADWESFRKTIENEFKKQGYDELEQAVAYLTNKPPKKQTINEKGQLDWCNVPVGREKMKSIIDSVKRVRNNLFHGGKYPYPVVAVKDPSRNRGLIEHSITVLKHLLCLSPEVKGHYFNTLE